MSPFSSEPGVVVIEPADDATDVPRGFDRIETIAGAWHASTEGNDSAFDDEVGNVGADFLATVLRQRNSRLTRKADPLVG